MSAAKGRLATAAWIALATHALAGAAMLFVLRRGLATNPDLDDRLAFVAGNPFSWRAAWFTWNAAALSILYFFYCFAAAHRIEGEKTALRFAVPVGALAVAFDLTAELIMMFALPAAARAGIEPFLQTDRAAVLLTGFGANTLYTVAAAILALGTRRFYPVWTWGAGAGVGIAGALLSVSVLAGSINGMFWTNAFLVPLLTLWLFGVAIAARR